MLLDWNHIYLLGWHSSDGKINLTTWTGNNKWIDVVIVGATDDDMSKLMWASYIHKPFDILNIPVGMNYKSYAKCNNGLHAFGWYNKNGITRPQTPPPDKWKWYYDLKGK